MKKDKNKGKKTLAAVSAVVVAGLTPGIISASAAGTALQAPSAAITAAQVVAIGGDAYGFDELYAMQQSGNASGSEASPQHATRYGAPSSQRPHPTYYGVQRPQGQIARPQVVAPSEDDAIYMNCLAYLMDFCTQLADEDPYTRGVFFTPDSDLSREIGFNESQLKALKAEIEERFGVEVSYHRFLLKGQLNTLHLISEYILKLKTAWQ